MKKKILVAGGTGTLGAPVARRLAADGFCVRLLARDPAKVRALFPDPFEVVAGDVTDVPGLERAMAGCWGVHVSVGGAVDRVSAENVARLAPTAGVERIGYVSGSTVFEENRWFPMVDGKLRAEAALAASGTPWMAFCPSWTMEMLPRFVRGGRATVIGRHPTPYHWFAAEDMARMVSRAFQREDTVGKRFFIHGPEAIAMRAALERYCRAVHPDITSVGVMPTWLAKGIGVLTRNTLLRFAADLMAYFDKVGELGDPSEANHVLGAPTTTLEEWIARRAARIEP